VEFNKPIIEEERKKRYQQNKMKESLAGLKRWLSRAVHTCMIKLQNVGIGLQQVKLYHWKKKLGCCWLLLIAIKVA
jgi:hypothetical protein